MAYIHEDPPQGKKPVLDLKQRCWSQKLTTNKMSSFSLINCHLKEIESEQPRNTSGNIYENEK